MRATGGKVKELAALLAGYHAALERWASVAAVVVIQDYASLDAPGTEEFTLSPQGTAVARGWAENSRYLAASQEFIATAAESIEGVQVVDLSPLVCPDS
jgi:hypothetical protein